MKKIIMIIVLAATHCIALCQNVVQGEYFIDTDLGYGNNTLANFTPSSDGSFPLSITVSSYTPGFHKLYIRTKDDSGNWSMTGRRNIEVLASEIKTNIVTGEYFIDTDPGFGLALPVTITSPDSVVLQNFTAATSGLSEGYHKLYGRLLDNYGEWSFTFRRNIEIYKSDTNKVLKAEYFFTTDEGFGNCAAATFATPAADGSFSFNIPRSTIPANADTLFVRVLDDIEGRWSITQINNTFTNVLPLTLLSFNAVKQNNTAILNWQTTDQINVAYFNVQRSTDGVHFTNVGKVNAVTDANTHHTYSLPDDIGAIQAGKVLYRLQMADNDGRFSYSSIALINIDVRFTIAIYPNPANGYFTINNYGNTGIKNAMLYVSDMTGRTFIKQQLNTEAKQNISITSLAKGMYIVSVCTNGNVYTQKLLVN